MRTPEELKKLITFIEDNDDVIPDDVDIDVLLNDMLVHIGSTDPELRDDLIYASLAEWIDDGIITATQMKHILATCLGEQHLFLGVGETDTDTVFTRSFSSLAIALALAMHDENPFLSLAEINNIKETVLRYISLEKDYRGFVAVKGWAHSVAHIADVLGNLSGCDKAIDAPETTEKRILGREGLLEVLQAIKTLVCNSQLVYTTEEDKRLAAACLMAICSELFTNKEIIGWLNEFNLTDTESKYEAMPGSYYQYVNSKHFMQSLYFMLLPDDDYKEICKHLLSFLIEEAEDEDETEA